MDKKPTRGGPRPGAGRPMGARDKTARPPRSTPSRQVVIGADLLESIRAAASERGETMRQWLETAAIQRLEREATDE